jgi:hypothetical protein
VATAKKDMGRGHQTGSVVSSGHRGHGGDHGPGKGEGNGGGNDQTGSGNAQSGNGKAQNGGGKAQNGGGKAHGGGGNGHGGGGNGNGGGGKGKKGSAPVAVPATAVPATPPATPAPAASSAPAPTRTRASRTRAAAGGRRPTTQNQRGVGNSVEGLAAAAGTGAAGGFAAAGVAPAGAGAAAAAASIAAGRTPAQSPRHALARENTDGSPVARTAERIVSVIPWPMWVLIGLLAAITLALGTRSWIGDRQRRRLREDVGLLQSALLPAVPASVAAVATSAAYRPADGPGAGGDFYDAFELGDGRLGVVVGDLSGHGREVLSQTALTRYTLRAYLEAGMAPRAALRTASGVLGHQLDVAFATVALAAYDPRSRTLTYALAGHPPPLILGSDGSLPPVTAAASAPLGAGLTTGIRETTVALPGEATVCFYTDGLIEARSHGELFGVQRLERTLAQLGPGATAAALLASVAEQCDHRPDDMAACVLGVAGEPLGPSARFEKLEIDGRELAGDRPEDFLCACGLPGEEVLRVLVAAAATLDHADAAVLRVKMTDSAPTVRVDPCPPEGLSVLAPEPIDERSLS